MRRPVSRSRLPRLLAGAPVALLPSAALGWDPSGLVASPWGVYIVFALAISAVIVLLLWEALGDDSPEDAKRKAESAARRKARRNRPHGRYASSGDRIAWPRR